MLNRISLLLLAAAHTAPAQSTGPKTMRVDFYHAGMATEEHFAIDRVSLEGDWPGPLDRWIDNSNLGRYQFEVRDTASQRAIYSRGFASVYGEWETTDEAKLQWRSLHESLRFPAPAAPVEVVIRKRGPKNEWLQVWSVSVDPADRTIDRSAPPRFTVWPVMHNGAPRDKVDLLLLGDGYTALEMERWHADARRTAEVLFAASPFREHRSQFNVWAIDTPADESGVSRPSDNVYRRSPLGAATAGPADNPAGFSAARVLQCGPGASIMRRLCLGLLSN